jgi:hypothetical protein
MAVLAKALVRYPRDSPKNADVTLLPVGIPQNFTAMCRGFGASGRELAIAGELPGRLPR